MKFYFTLHFKMFYRKIKELEFHPLIAVIAILGSFIGGSYALFSKLNYAEYCYVVLCLILNYLLGGKERNEFLKNLFTKDKYRLVRLYENLLVSVPFIAFLIFKGFYLAPIYLIIGSAVLSLKNNVGQSFFTFPTPFSRWPFEFTTGFRQSFLVFVLMYLLAISAVSADNFNLGIFALLMCFIVCQYFHFKIEPHFYVWVHSQSAKKFVLKKMKIAAYYSLIITLPLAVLLTIYNWENTHWIVLALVIGVIYSMLGAAAKYAYYPSELTVFHQFIIAVGLLVPPISLLLILFFYSSSVKSLKTYLK